MKNKLEIDQLRKDMINSIKSFSNYKDEFLNEQSTRVLISFTSPLYREDWIKKYDDLISI